MGVISRFKGTSLALHMTSSKIRYSLTELSLNIEYFLLLNSHILPRVPGEFYFDIQMVLSPFSDASQDLVLPVTRGATFFCGLSSVTVDSSIIRGY